MEAKDKTAEVLEELRGWNWSRESFRDLGYRVIDRCLNMPSTCQADRRSKFIPVTPGRASWVSVDHVTGPGRRRPRWRC